MPRPPVSPSVTRARNKKNRIQCDNRQYSFHNILIALLQLEGFRFTIRKPGKVNPKKTIPAIPVVRIERSGVVFFDVTAVEPDKQMIEAWAEREQLSKQRTRQYVRQFVDTVTTQHLLSCATSGGAITCHVTSSANASGVLPPKPLIQEISYHGVVFSKYNVIELGELVFAHFIPSMVPFNKNEDFELPFVDATPVLSATVVGQTPPPSTDQERPAAARHSLPPLADVRLGESLSGDSGGFESFFSQTH